MSRKRKAHRSERIEFLERQLDSNTLAIKEGPTKKKWTTLDLKPVQALNSSQEDMFHHFHNETHLCAHGSAGTGKTFLAAYLALRELLDPRTPQKKIIIVRSAVATRDLGFLPGTLDEKVSEFETPYKDIFAELLGRNSSYDDMKAAGLVKFLSTSYIRGLTWDDALIIVDEGQNLAFHEINSVMTRLGQNSRIIFTGDFPQTDLRKHRGDVSGMEDFVKVVDRLKDFARVEFSHHDIVRSKFVKSWIIASEEVVGL